MRGRRRSPPGLPAPPGSFRRDDRRYPTAPRERRRRSITPDRFRRGGSPPPYKRGRYGRDADDFFPPRGGYDQGPYGRPSPPPRRDGPRPYKDFCRTLPDDVTPEQAQKDYQQYLSDYWGSAVRADFETKKNEDWMRSRFDPRGMKKALEERNAEAKAEAKTYSDDMESGLLDPHAKMFNQGSTPIKTGKAKGDSEDAEDEAEEAEEDKAGNEASETAQQAVVAPKLCWAPERVALDFSISRRLIAKLDNEKGITSNDLFKEEDGSKQDMKAEEIKDEKESADRQDTAIEGKNVNGKSEDKVGDADTKMEDAKTEAAEEETPAQTKDEAALKAQNGKPGSEGDIGRLDLQMTYLWRVHGVDYYAGKEAAEPLQFKLRSEGKRMLRGPRPEEGEQATEAEDKKNRKAAEKQIDLVWKKRLASGDPFEASIQQEKMDNLLNEWIEDQVKKIDDNKWGCKLSQKLFVGRDYVLKHIKLKHTEKVEDQKSRICDDVFWQNYKKFRDEEQKIMQAELAKVQQAMQMQQPGSLPMPWDGATPPAGRGQQMAPVISGGPSPAFPGGVGMMGIGMAPALPAVPRSMGNTMLPGAMLPQPGQVLVLAPGAGPMGPFISVPISEAGGYGRAAMGPGRGGPPGRGPGRGGGRGFNMYGPPPPRAPPKSLGREYFDLDNPSNNRSVLDYGDL